MKFLIIVFGMVLIPSLGNASDIQKCTFQEISDYIKPDSKRKISAFDSVGQYLYWWSSNHQGDILPCFNNLMFKSNKKLYPYVEKHYWKSWFNTQIPCDNNRNEKYAIIYFNKAHYDDYEKSAAYFDQNGTMVAAVQSHYLEKDPDPAHPGVPVDPRAATIVTIRKGYDTPALRHYIWVDTMPSVVVTGANARQLPIVEIPQP